MEKGHIVKHLIHGFGEGMAQYHVEFYSRENQNRLPALPKKTSLIDNIAGYKVQRTMSFRILPQLFALGGFAMSRHHLSPKTPAHVIHTGVSDQPRKRLARSALHVSVRGIHGLFLGLMNGSASLFFLGGRTVFC